MHAGLVNARRYVSVPLPLFIKTSLHEPITLILISLYIILTKEVAPDSKHMLNASSAASQTMLYFLHSQDAKTKQPNKQI